MRSNQAKQIPISELLERLGIHPEKEMNNELWYCSPFRHETKASFKLSKDRRAWFDHGSGQGGNILDFVMQYQQTDVRGALRYLRHVMTGAIQTTTTPYIKSESPLPHQSAHNDDTFRITKLQPLQNHSLIAYLQQRGISKTIASDWLQEIHYTRDDNHYYALAFSNDTGGYELRNQYFQGTRGTKAITTLRASENQSSSVAVFEGFIDFLSAIALSGHRPSMDVIILNSVSMGDSAIQRIREMGSTQVHLYLDRDDAGKQLTQLFYEKLPDITIHDQSKLYESYKDLNEYLVGRQKTGIAR